MIPMKIDRRAVLLAGGGLLLAAPFTKLFSATKTPFEDPDQMYAALDAGPGHTISIGGGSLRIVFADGAPGLNRQRTLDWIHRSAVAVTTYFGRYPVREHGLLVFANSDAQVSHGVTYGYRGPATQVSVGIDATADTFARDWVMVHEMTHTALPNLPRCALWLQEGNATYVEPIARAQAGQISAESVWRDSVIGMPHGLPSPGDVGMDGTHTWGRLYWGGAMFWLSAEIAFYEQTDGKRSLRDALRAINRASGGNQTLWLPEQMMQVGDDATRTKVLTTLYQQFAGARMAPDLDKIFARLGVIRRTDGQIEFDDRAPLASLRRAMTHA
jgi:hypothetical protein